MFILLTTERREPTPRRLNHPAHITTPCISPFPRPTHFLHYLIFSSPSSSASLFLSSQVYHALHLQVIIRRPLMLCSLLPSSFLFLYTYRCSRYSLFLPSSLLFVSAPSCFSTSLLWTLTSPWQCIIVLVLTPVLVYKRRHFGSLVAGKLVALICRSSLSSAFYSLP